MNGKWTDEETAILEAFAAEHVRIGRIPWLRLAEMLGRTKHSCEDKWARIRARNQQLPQPRFSRGQIHLKASAEALIERDRRYAIKPRDLTAELMGDPLPGESALEKRRGQK
jgi:Myb-like DNA-binding domain